MILAGGNPIIIGHGSGSGGSGSGAVQQATTNISSAQLLALPGTPIMLVPAPGAGNVINNLNIFFSYHFNTTPYAAGNADNQLGVQWGSAGPADGGETVMVVGFLDQASDQVVSGSSFMPVGATSLTANEPLNLILTGTTPALTNGDGTLKVVVTYSIVTA